nr:hypothetical protein [Tanacetum cinerariifolium]
MDNNNQKLQLNKSLTWPFFQTLLPPGAFRLFVIYFFYLPSFPAPHAFGSQTAGDVVISKFDMHVYTSVLTSDEVNSLVAEYAIPLDLHPCIPPFGLTMNRLPTDKIALEGPFFLIDRRAIPDAMPWRHQDSSVADSAPTSVRTKDIQWLCVNVIDLRPVHLAMLYAVGRTTIWKHVGHHPVFKDGEGTVATNESNRSGSGTHTSASPLNNIVPNEAEFTTGGDGLTQGPVLRIKDDTERRFGNVDDTTKVNSPFSGQSPRSQHSNPSNEDMRRVSSSSRGSHRQAFPRRNPDESGIGSFFI